MGQSMVRMTRLLELALKAKLGIKVQTTNGDGFKRKLYVAVRKLRDLERSEFSVLNISLSPIDRDLVIIHKDTDEDSELFKTAMEDIT